MMCARPFRRGVQEFGCGQCMPCRINRSRLWTLRLLLEARFHSHSWYVTLTYDPKFCPQGLEPRDLTLFLKRLRDRLSAPFRYYAVGEYGDHTGRPHFHLMLFGIVESEVWLIEDSWGRGFTHIGFVQPESCAYVCKYMCKDQRPIREAGKLKEFARMSRKPGIGHGIVAPVAEWLTSEIGSRYVRDTGDVVTNIRIDGRVMAFGRYIRSKLRLASGFADGGQPDRVAVADAIEKLAELSVFKNWVAREAKRLQVERQAISRHRVSMSKKRVGI